MRKNRIIAAVWMTVIALIIVSMIGYVVYAALVNPYFVSKNVAFISNILIVSRGVS